MGIVPDTGYEIGGNANFYRPSVATEKDLDYWSAAFRQENDVYNFVEWLNVPKFQADPNFDPRASAENSPFFGNFTEEFIDVQSQAEWDYVESRIAREVKDRKTLEDAGWMGLLAGMTAGVLSPTIMVPAGAAATASSVTMGFARAAVMGGASVLAQEAVLQTNQYTRTAMESGVNVAGGAILAGVLGGAIRFINPMDIGKAASHMVNPVAGATIHPAAPPTAPVIKLAPMLGTDLPDGMRRQAVDALQEYQFALDGMEITDDALKLLDAEELRILNLSSAPELKAVLADPTKFKPTVEMMQEFGEYRQKLLEKPTKELVQESSAMLELQPLIAKEIENEGTQEVIGKLKVYMETIIRELPGITPETKAKAQTALTEIIEKSPKFAPGNKISTVDLEEAVTAAINKAKKPEKVVITKGDQDSSIGAKYDPQPVLPFGDPEGIMDVTGLSRFRALKVTALNWLSPIIRGINSESATRRMVTAQFSNAGLYTKANKAGKISAEEGDIESRVKQHLAQMAVINKELGKIFLKYWMDKSNSQASATFNALFKGKPYKAYLEAVGDGMRKYIDGDKTGIEAVDEAAKLVIDRLYMPLLREARVLKMEPFNQMTDQYALRILLQRPKVPVIQAEYNAAKAILQENALMILTKNAYELQELLVLAPDGSPLRKKLLAKDDPGNTDIAEAIVDEILSRILNNERREGMLDVFNINGLNISKFLYIDPDRVWANNRRWEEFLERDAEKLSRSFARGFGPDLEIFRTFRTRRPDIEQSKDVPIHDEFRAWLTEELDKAAVLPENLKKKRQLQLNKERDEFYRDLEVMVGRLRHTWGAPKDPYSVGTRFGRYALQLNTMRLMGSVVLSSIPDLARPIMKYGFINTMRHGLIPMLTELKAYKASADEAILAGAAIDVDLHGRAGAMADLFDEVEYGNVVDRMMQYGAGRVGLIGLFDYWNRGLKRFSAAVMQGKMIQHMQELEAGTISAKDRAWLASLNINEATAKALNKAIRELGGTEISPGRWLPNTEEWSQISDDRIATLAEAKAIAAIEKSLARDIRMTFLNPTEVKKGLQERYMNDPKLPVKDLAEYTKKLGPRMTALKSAQTTSLDLTILQQVADYKKLDDIIAAVKDWPKGVTTKERKTQLISDIMFAAKVPPLNAKAEFGRWRAEFSAANRTELRKEGKPTPPSSSEIAGFYDDAFNELVLEGQRLQRIYRSAIARSVEDTIVTPGLERPNMMDKGTAQRLLFQFRSFTVTSTMKIGLAAAQDARLGNWPQIALGANMSIAFGMLSYYLWAMSVGGNTFERAQNELDAAINGDNEALGRFVDEAIARSGLLGVMAEAMKFAERVPGTTDYVTFANEQTARSPFLNPVVELLGPTFGGIAPTLGRILYTLDDPTSETFRKGKQMLPYQNLFYLRRVFDKINEAAMDATGVPYK